MSEEFFAVMDADLQHDERILPNLLEAVASGSCDLAVGSRATEGALATGRVRAAVHELLGHNGSKILLRVSSRIQ